MASTNYLCCGVPSNPWDDIFCGGGEATQPVSYGEQKPDWDNPFGLAPPQQSTNFDARSVETSGTGGRSSGTRGEARSTISAVSTISNKTFKEISREEKAKSRALFLSETLMTADRPKKGEDNRKKHSVGLGGNAMSAVHAEMILEKNKEGTNTKNVDDRILANQAAAAWAIKVKAQIEKTETTRPKKELTPEDVRDPETVPGMVSKAGIAMEEDAKKKARIMISDGKYPYHEKAGHAIWSFHDVNRIRKTDGKINPIV